MSYVTPYVCIVLLQRIYRGVSDHTVLLLRSVDDCICANCSLERNILRGVLASVLPFPIVVLVDFHKYSLVENTVILLKLWFIVVILMMIDSIELYAHWCYRLCYSFEITWIVDASDDAMITWQFRLCIILYICILVLIFFYAVSWIPLYVVSPRQTHRTFLG